jgi:NAD(P)-dependent dehydrogenase (short-subunit alcohol dehydrogenase family)
MIFASLSTGDFNRHVRMMGFTMLTIHYAKSQPGIKFNALEPGYTATDMTTAFEGGRSPEESARTVVRLATLDIDGPTGTFQSETTELCW